MTGFETLRPIIAMILQVVLILALLMLADRWLHRHLQGVMLLISKDAEVALWLYAIILLPGVTLHELSHALTAALLGVKIGRINILPRRVGKRIQLGFVPVQETDIVRASLIGLAPLLLGGMAVVAVGYFVFGTPDIVAALAAGDWYAGLTGLASVMKAPDMWLWAYIVFAISNTMLPSKSDVHAWPALGVVTAGLIVITALLGGERFLLTGAGHVLNLSLRWIVLLGASTLLVDLPFFALIWIVQKLVERLRGVRLEFRGS